MPKATQPVDINGVTFDALIEDVRTAAPEMLALNCNYEGPVHLIFESVRIELETAMVS